MEHRRVRAAMHHSPFCGARPRDAPLTRGWRGRRASPPRACRHEREQRRTADVPQSAQGPAATGSGAQAAGATPPRGARRFSLGRGATPRVDHRPVGAERRELQPVRPQRPRGIVVVGACERERRCWTARRGRRLARRRPRHHMSEASSAVLAALVVAWSWPETTRSTRVPLQQAPTPLLVEVFAVAVRARRARPPRASPRTPTLRALRAAGLRQLGVEPVARGSRPVVVRARENHPHVASAIHRVRASGRRPLTRRGGRTAGWPRRSRAPCTSWLPTGTSGTLRKSASRRRRNPASRPVAPVGDEVARVDHELRPLARDRPITSV